MPLILVNPFPPTSSAARFESNNGTTRIQNFWTAHDLSVGVGWRYVMKEESECDRRRRLGPLSLRIVVAPRAILDHLQHVRYWR